MSDSFEVMSTKDIQEKFTTLSNNLKETVKGLFDLYNLCKSREDIDPALVYYIIVV